MDNKRFAAALVLLYLLIGSSCEKSDSSEGLIGLWRCSETYSSSNYRTYDVSIDQLNRNDSTMYIVYNMYNLGMDFETYVLLNDSVFTIQGCNSDSYDLSGTGRYNKSQTIEWSYAVTGLVDDPVVSALYEKN